MEKLVEKLLRDKNRGQRPSLLTPDSPAHAPDSNVPTPILRRLDPNLVYGETKVSDKKKKKEKDRGRFQTCPTHSTGLNPSGSYPRLDRHRRQKPSEARLTLRRPTECGHESWGPQKGCLGEVAEDSSVVPLSLMLLGRGPPTSQNLS